VKCDSDVAWRHATSCEGMLLLPGRLSVKIPAPTRMEALLRVSVPRSVVRDEKPGAAYRDVGEAYVLLVQSLQTQAWLDPSYMFAFWRGLALRSTRAWSSQWSPCPLGHHQYAYLRGLWMSTFTGCLLLKMWKVKVKLWPRLLETWGPLFTRLATLPRLGRPS